MTKMIATGMVVMIDPARLTADDLCSGWGLRTLSSRSAGFNPFGYHAGTVWPHDTAIAADNLRRAGFDEAALALVEGLVAAAPHFGYRLPELFAGETRRPGAVPLPYPGACRPQAWAASAALLALRTLLGLEADVPEGRVTVAPIRPFPYDRLGVRGLRIGDGVLDVTVEHGSLTIGRRPPGLTVVTP